jgi:predicted glycosyltransferase
MKILVDINHPAHVHFFRNLIQELRGKGIEVVVTASDKDIAFELLRLYSLSYIDLGSYGNNLLVKLINVPIMGLKMWKVALKERPDLMIGLGSSRITHAGFLTGIKSFVFTDTEHAREQILIYKPFASRIYTPDCFLLDMGKKHVRYPSYHELAYLHPRRFAPNKKVLDRLNINAGEKIFVVRFVSWGASHDVGHSGLSDEGKVELVDLLAMHGRVIITSEGIMPKVLEKYRMKVPANLIHDLLYFATMYVGEGGTMASEAAVLGTPSIFISTLKAGTFEDLKNRFNLLVQCYDDQSTLEQVTNLLSHNGLKEEWRIRHKVFMECKTDATDYILCELKAFEGQSKSLSK